MTSKLCFIRLMEKLDLKKKTLNLFVCVRERIKRSHRPG